MDADGQSRRRRRPRRVNGPGHQSPIVAPGEEGASEGEERVISTADEASGVDLTEPQRRKNQTTTRKTDQEQMRETIDSLSEHVNKLKRQAQQMQENDRSLLTWSG